MKTSVYGYQEVQDMAAIDVMNIIWSMDQTLETEGLGPRDEDCHKAIQMIAELIDVSRSILRTGLTFEDHKRLAAIMEKIK